jgi:hypothetical protein
MRNSFIPDWVDHPQPCIVRLCWSSYPTRSNPAGCWTTHTSSRLSQSARRHRIGCDRTYAPNRRTGATTTNRLEIMARGTGSSRPTCLHRPNPSLLQDDSGAADTKCSSDQVTARKLSGFTSIRRVEIASARGRGLLRHSQPGMRSSVATGRPMGSRIGSMTITL